jgi:tRNA pseudouridine38-40 synthase
VARTWKLTLAYDGGLYAGWQVQPGLETVQGRLSVAIERITGERVLPQGSGRTDAGVHALGQVASFRLCAGIAPGSFARALNHRLPASIRVLGAELAEDGFHARHSSRSKTYEYRIWRGAMCPPWSAPYVYAWRWPLRLDAMREAAAAVVGEHDFRSFAAREPDFSARAGEESEANCVRLLLSSAWEERSPELLCYRVRGTGFLHHMVRNLVGTFLDVGRGQMESGAIGAILAARERSAAGATAPARGLFLESVEY